MVINRGTYDQLALKNLQETKTSLNRVQSFPYREELLSVMNPNVYTCSPDTIVKEVAKEITRNKVSSAVIVDKTGYPIGIITENDLVRQFVASDDLSPHTCPASKVMSKEISTLTPHNNVYQALALLARKNIKHLPLVKNKKVAGVVTLRQILKLRYPEPMTIVEGIASSESIEELKDFKETIPVFVEAKLGIAIRAIDIVVMISMINQDIHRRVMELAVKKIGPPPSPFCLYVTGSHGRLENLLSTDQDHGMIIADSDDGLVQYDPYYVELSGTFSDWLNEIGFEYCPGSIMCSNPLWRKSLSEWKIQVQYWIDNQVPELGRFSTVLFDSVPIYGDFNLFEEMNDFAFSLLSKHHEVSLVLHHEEASHKVPTGIWGGFVTEKAGKHRGEMEIKRSGLMFLIEGVRILALRHGIREAGTLKRIERLVHGNHLHKHDGEYFEAAYLFLLHLALRTQADKARVGEEINTFLNPNNLSSRDQETLKHAFKAVSSMQELIAAEFGELIL